LINDNRGEPLSAFGVRRTAVNRENGLQILLGTEARVFLAGRILLLFNTFYSLFDYLAGIFPFVLSVVLC
jgi:hypothetical protein